MIVEGSRPVLLLDVGFAATGVAVATLHDDGPHVALSVIVPTDGCSPKTLREKRSCAKFGDLAERLYDELTRAMDNPIHADLSCMVVFAEVPVMGSRSASGMRSMAMALACYRIAVSERGCHHVEVTRNDVVAAAFGKKKPVGDAKARTRYLVRERFVVDDSALPPGINKATRDLHDNAYDAAAVLFAVANHDHLRKLAGWGDFNVS